MIKTYLQIFFTFFIIIGNSQTFDTNSSNLNSQFQTTLKQISLGKSNIPLEIDGSTYFFKKPQDAVLILTDGGNPISLKTNYNLLNETFEVKSEDGLLNLAPNKINSIKFIEHSFVVFDSKFYLLITKNDDFSVLKSLISETIQFILFDLIPNLFCAFSIDFLEISKTSILLKPKSSKLSTSLLSPAPISMILEFKFKFNDLIISNEIFGTF